MPWIDSHCHLDAPEFDADREAVLAAARAAGVAMLVLPAVAVAGFDGLIALAHRHGLAYALGIHPLYVDAADDADLDRLAAALQARRDDPHLVAVGEIGLDHFVPGLDLARQERFYAAQLKLARSHGLPVILHVRRSADALLKQLRRTEVAGGIAHAFNGSDAQALQFADARVQARFRRRDDLRARAADPPPRGHAAGRGAGARNRRARHPAAVAVREGRRARAARTQPQRAGRVATHRPDAGHAARLDPRGDGLAHRGQRAGRLAAPEDAAGRRRAMKAAAGRLQGLPPIAHRSARLLVLGSFPGAASLAARQYYGHPRNHFWPILSALWAIDLVALDYPARVAALERRGLALWDVYANCRREGSLDTAIADAEPNDLAGTGRRACRRLRAIGHNGGESARAMRHTRALGLPVLRLPSTSPANASWSFERKLAAWRGLFSLAGLL